MNQVSLIGRMARDPELHYTQSETAVCNATVAVSGAGNFISDEEGSEAGFFRVVIWGDQAVHVAEYCKKGREVGISGRLQQRSYENQEGETAYITEIVASRVDFLRIPEGQEEENKESRQERKSKAGSRGSKGYKRK